MSTGTDISAIYREFTDALTEILAENAVGPVRVVAALRGHALPSRSTLSIVSTHTSWRWRARSRIGKPCRTPVHRPALPVGNNTAAEAAVQPQRRFSTTQRQTRASVET